MTKEQLEQALTDDNIQKAHTAYERAWLGDFKIKRNHSSDKADAAAVLAMRQSLVSALLSVEPTPTQTCATCKFWDADEDMRAGGECRNTQSPIYRIYCSPDRESWAHDWGCTLYAPAHAPAPPEGRTP